MNRLVASAALVTASFAGVAENIATPERATAATTECNTETGPYQLEVEQMASVLGKVVVIDGVQTPEDCVQIMNLQHESGIPEGRGYAGEKTRRVFKGILSALSTITLVKPVATAEDKFPSCPPAFVRGERVSEPCKAELIQALQNDGYLDTGNQLVLTLQRYAHIKEDSLWGPESANAVISGRAKIVNPVTDGKKIDTALFDLSDQLGYFVKDGKTYMWSISSGTEVPYVEKAPNGTTISGDGITPTGEFTIQSEEGEDHVSKNTGFKLPLFRRIIGGIGIHGGNVSIRKASHGCLRTATNVMRILATKLGLGKWDRVIIRK